MKGTVIPIRRATAEDVVRIGTIARAAYVKYVPRIGREPAPMAVDYAAETAAQRVVVIETARQIRGYMVAWAEPDAYFIDNIAVAPECQGRGLGRCLMDHAASEAKRLGLSVLRLYTNVMMVENVSMYAHLGFFETHRAFEEGFHRVHMRRSLS